MNEVLKTLIDYLGLSDFKQSLGIPPERVKQVLDGDDLTIEELNVMKGKIPDLNLAAFITKTGHPISSYVEKRYIPKMSERDGYHELYYITEKLLRLRKALNMTQEDLAEVIGKHRSVVSTAESGRQGYTLKHLIRASIFFGVSIDWIAKEGAPASLLKDLPSPP